MVKNTEIIRGGIISVDKGQKEAAHAIGMTHWQSMVHVVLPQAVRNIMPSIGNEFVVNIKDSSVLNVISVSELFFVSKSAAGTYARYFEAFFITAVIYFVLTFTVTRLLRLLEKKMVSVPIAFLYASVFFFFFVFLSEKSSLDVPMYTSRSDIPRLCIHPVSLGHCNKRMRCRPKGEKEKNNNGC